MVAKNVPIIKNIMVTAEDKVYKHYFNNIIIKFSC